VLVENVSTDTAIAAANGINLSCERAASDSDYAFLRGLLANLGSGPALEGAKGLADNPQIQPLVTALILNLNASAVAPLIASGVNENASMQAMIPALMGELNPTTAQTIAMAMNANPEMTSYLLQDLDPSTVTAVLSNKDNQDAIIGLISHMDGSVIAKALNAEYDLPGESLVERMIPFMSGVEIADILSEFGYEFLVDLMTHLDGRMVARALNNAGEDFLSQLIAFIDPDFVIDLINAEANPDYSVGELGGAIKNLNFEIFIYMTKLGIGLGGSSFKALEARVYLTHDGGVDEIPPYP
jgi:hypothetical protein